MTVIANHILAQSQFDLTGAGIVIMTISVGMVLGLFSFCLLRILREPKR